jgi:hypothetical protein
MSDAKHGELVDYFGVWGPSRFRARNGKPLGLRALELKIHKFNLPIIRTGHGALIDPVEGDDRLREFVQQRPQKMRPRGLSKIRIEAAAAAAAAAE